MQWFPGKAIPGVWDMTEYGLSYGSCILGRVWHGDQVDGDTVGVKAIIPGPGHDACEAEFARRKAAADADSQ